MIASRARTEQLFLLALSGVRAARRSRVAKRALRSRCYDALGERDNIASFSLGFRV